jgi:hypothetical protein
MTRGRVVAVLALVAAAGLVYWISTRTEWVDTEIPMPARGEARTNPTYAAQRFVEKLGAHATRDQLLTLPPPTSVIVLSAWTWGLSSGRRDALERWVESGGRLVIDSSVNTDEEFEHWSGLGFHYQGADDDDDSPDDEAPPCRRFNEQQPQQVALGDQAHWLCGFDVDFALTTRQPAEWTLSDPKLGVQALRVRVGRGRVAHVNGDPFRARRLFDGDHGWLLARAADVRPGDDVHFLSEGDYPSLLALTWQRGEPVVVLGMVFVAFLLWRGAVRFGPLVAPTPTARRSLAEQIRGTGQFALHHGGNESLHAACVRALDEAARRRIAGYPHLTKKARAEAVAGLAGVEAKPLAAAIYSPRTRRSHELRSTIALIETARRRLLKTRQGLRLEGNQTMDSHGN